MRSADQSADFFLSSSPSWHLWFGVMSIPSDAPVVVIKSFFQNYDKDENGTLDMEELRQLVYDIGYYLNDLELQAALRSMDKDHNSVIDFDEFLHWWQNEEKFSRLRAATNENLREAIALFRKYDKDKSGTITVDEYRVLCKDMGHTGLTDAQVRESLSILDKDGNGEISFNEWLDWLNWF